MNIEQHRPGVMALLCTARGGPLPNDDEAWRDFRLYARAYVADRPSQNSGSAVALTVHSQRYADLGKALRRARELAEAALRDPILARGLAAAWPIKSAAQALLSSPEAELAGAVSAVAALQQCSEAAAQGSRRKRGRPIGSGNLTRFTVVDLMHLYQGATERKAGAGKGPFLKFVGLFLRAVGADMSEDAILSVFKKVPALKRKS